MKKFTYISQTAAIALLCITLCNSLQAQTIQPVSRPSLTNEVVKDTNTATLNTQEKGHQQLFAFPNPCNGSFNIQAKKATSYTVVNAAGQAIESGELDTSNNYATTITGLEKGYYFILANNELQTTMIVVK